MARADVAAMPAYNPVHTMGNRYPGGCQIGLSRPSYQSELVSDAMPPDTTQAVTPAIVLAHVAAGLCESLMGGPPGSSVLHRLTRRGGRQVPDGAPSPDQKAPANWSGPSVPVANWWVVCTGLQPYSILGLSLIHI